MQVVTDSIRSEGVYAPGAGLDGGLSNMISDAMNIRGRGEWGWTRLGIRNVVLR